MNDKPATILVREFKDKIVTAINESNLPAFALIPILQNALHQLEVVEEEQYQDDLNRYMEKEGD